jgi:GTPase SAR1 family protein
MSHLPDIVYIPDSIIKMSYEPINIFEYQDLDVNEFVKNIHLLNQDPGLKILLTGPSPSGKSMLRRAVMRKYPWINYQNMRTDTDSNKPKDTRHTILIEFNEQIPIMCNDEEKIVEKLIALMSKC